MTDTNACGANTPSGPCRVLPVSGKKRCFRHGGAPGSGAPKGSQNAYKHGCYTKQTKEERRELNQCFKELEAQIEALHGELGQSKYD
jgi:hypothetical protein